MKKQVLSILSTTMVLTAPLAMALDITEGTVLAHDRKAKTLVFSDRTVWQLDELASSLPANLKAGDRVEIQYDSDEDGVTRLSSITILSGKLPVSIQPGAQDILEGTVLALDRKANTLVLTDKTIWALGESKLPIPVNLKAGDRIEIQYESDEDGVTSISNIKVLP